MLSKNEIKYIQSLCQKKQRDFQGLFIAEGNKLLEELLNSHYAIRKVYALGEWIQEHPNLTMDIQEVTAPELAKISQLQTPNRVLAIVEQPNLQSV